MPTPRLAPAPPQIMCSRPPPPPPACSGFPIRWVCVVQAAIPISMVISKRLTGARYSITQYIGAVVVASGIVIAIGPSLTAGSGNSTKAQELIWSLVLVLSCVPMALSSVYKELALGESELDPIYLNG